tara:strand:- start:494 stop:1537 length:1044 start_codon:yes stop_codon:yes gene_type:complete
MFEELRKALWESVESWQNSDRQKKWAGDTGLTRKNEYNGNTAQAIDLHPIIDEPHDENWTFNYGSQFPQNIIQNNFQWRNKTISWLPPDSESRFAKNLADPIMGPKIEHWKDKEIKYSFNNNGFRKQDNGQMEDFFSDQGGIMYLGCSITFGVGVNLEQTWSWHLHNRKWPEKRYLNFGCPGQGLETYYRILKGYIGAVKPEMVIVTYPWASSRAEMFDPKLGDWVNLFMSVQKGHLMINMRNQQTDMSKDDMDWFTRMSLFSKEPSVLRYTKHKEAISWLCHTNGAKLIWMTHNNMASAMTATRKKINTAHFTDFARDGMHQGPHSHEALSYEIEDKVDECLSNVK